MTNEDKQRKHDNRFITALMIAVGYEPFKPYDKDVYGGKPHPLGAVLRMEDTSLILIGQANQELGYCSCCRDNPSKILKIAVPKVRK